MRNKKISARVTETFEFAAKILFVEQEHDFQVGKEFRRVIFNQNTIRVGHVQNGIAVEIVDGGGFDDERIIFAPQCRKNFKSSATPWLQF